MEELTSQRYTSSRIKRVALQNLLGIEENLIKNALTSPLYLKVLAINKDKKELLSALSESEFPLLLRAHDDEKLTPIAKQVYEKDLFAEKIYNLLYPNNQKQNPFI